MSAAELRLLLEERLAPCQVRVEDQQGHFVLHVGGEVFRTLSTVQRQQHVYGALGELITSGRIHSVSIKTYTPEDWRQHS